VRHASTYENNIEIQLKLLKHNANNIQQAPFQGADSTACEHIIIIIIIINKLVNAHDRELHVILKQVFIRVIS